MRRVSTLPRFLAAIALFVSVGLLGHHHWEGQYGGNFNPDASLDTSQVIDATEQHGLLTI